MTTSYYFRFSFYPSQNIFRLKKKKKQTTKTQSIPVSSGCFNLFSNHFIRSNRRSHHVLFVPNALMHHIADCAIRHLEISGNGYHGRSRIRLYSFLHPLIISERCECFLRFATGGTSPLEVSSSFRTLCTNDPVTSKKVQSQHRCVLRSAQQLQHDISFHALADSSLLMP